MSSSHISGSKAIMGVFVLPRINCIEVFVGRHKLGVGDHRRPHIVSLTTESVLGAPVHVQKIFVTSVQDVISRVRVC